MQEIEPLTHGHPDVADASAKLRSFQPMVLQSAHCDYVPPLQSVYSVINKFNDYLKRNDILRSLASSSQTLQTIHPDYHKTFENIRQWSEDGGENENDPGDIIAEREAHAVRRLSDLQKMVKQLSCLQRPAAELQEALEVKLEEIKGEAISTISGYIDAAGNTLLSINSDLEVVRKQRLMVSYLQKSQTASWFMSADQVMGYTTACIRTADSTEGRLNQLKENYDSYTHILNALVEIVASGAKAVHQHVKMVLSTTEETKRRLTNDTTKLAIEGHVYFSDQATHFDDEKRMVSATLEELNRRIKTSVMRRNFVSPILLAEKECMSQQLESLTTQLEVISQRRAEVWFVIERLRKDFKQNIPFPPNPEAWKLQNGCYWVLPTVGLAIDVAVDR